ncbi:peptidoglycan-binding protein [Streptomyces kebangsaanensis]|uniref:Peptidoglycan-binding protein n=1 Tax=Streptomyces kebangsaanensis TaxID=864058 RepID=A0ABW6KLL2_9ACTN
MEEQKGHVCPECGAPRGTDNAPSCACGSRASDALRDARTAEAAAAEDFDPLRIRPYVEIEEAERGAEDEENARARPRAEPEGPAPADATMPLRAVPAPTNATMPLRAVSGLPTPLAPQRGGPNASDLSLFESATAGPSVDAGAGAEGSRQARRGGRRRRTTVVLAGSATVVAVVAAAGFTSALLSHDPPERDRATRSVRESVPDASADSSATPSPTASGASSAPSASASESASGSPSADESASPSPSSSASDTASQSPSASASQAGTVPGAAGSEQSEPAQPTTTLRAPAPPDTGPALRPGDRGPEVTELQQRLRQLRFYNGRPDGFYNGRVEKSVRSYQWARGITADEPGVYGPATRASLESETRAS